MRDFLTISDADLLQDTATLQDADQAEDAQHPDAFAQAQRADAWRKSALRGRGIEPW